MEQDYMSDECGSILQQLESQCLSAEESVSDNDVPLVQSSSSSTSSSTTAEISKAEKLISNQSKDNEEKENTKTDAEDGSKTKERKLRHNAANQRYRAREKLKRQQDGGNEEKRNKKTSAEKPVSKQAGYTRKWREKKKLQKQQDEGNEEKENKKLSAEDDSKTKERKLKNAAANRRCRAKKKLNKQQDKDNEEKEDKKTDAEDDSKTKERKLREAARSRKRRAKKKVTTVVQSYEQFQKTKIQQANINKSRRKTYKSVRDIVLKHKKEFGSKPSSNPTVQKVLDKYTKKLQCAAETRRRRKIKDLQSCDQSPIASTSSPFQSHAEEIILNQRSPNIIEPCLAPFDNDDLSLGTGCDDSGSSEEGSEDLAAGQTVPETFETPTIMDHSSYSKNLQHRVKKNSSRHLKKVTSATTIGEDLLSPGTSDVDVDANSTAVTGIMAGPGMIVRKRRVANKNFRELVSINSVPKSSASSQSTSLVSKKFRGSVSYSYGVKRTPVTNSELSATLPSTASLPNNLPEKQNQESIMGKKRQPYITKVQYAIEHQRVLNELKAATDNITTEVMAAIVGDPLEIRIKQWPLSSTNEVSNLVKFKIKMTAELDQKEQDNKNLRLLNKSLLTQLEQFRSNLKVPMEIEAGLAPQVNRISESMSLDVMNYSSNMEILELELKTLLEKRILNPLTADEICRKYLNEYKKELDLTKFVMQSPACLADQIPGLVLEKKKEATTAGLSSWYLTLDKKEYKNTIGLMTWKVVAYWHWKRLNLIAGICGPYADTDFGDSRRDFGKTVLITINNINKYFKKRWHFDLPYAVMGYPSLLEYFQKNTKFVVLERGLIFVEQPMEMVCEEIGYPMPCSKLGLPVMGFRYPRPLPILDYNDSVEMDKYTQGLLMGFLREEEVRTPFLCRLIASPMVVLQNMLCMLNIGVCSTSVNTVTLGSMDQCATFLEALKKHGLLLQYLAKAVVLMEGPPLLMRAQARQITTDFGDDIFPCTRFNQRYSKHPLIVQCLLLSYLLEFLKSLFPNEDVQRKMKDVALLKKFEDVRIGKKSLDLFCLICSEPFDSQSAFNAHKARVHPLLKTPCDFQSCADELMSLGVLMP